MERAIKNFEALATTDIRRDALTIAEAGYAAIDVGAALARDVTVVEETLRIRDASYALGGRHVYFVGIGKCAFAAAEAIERILGEALTGGVALDVSARDRGAIRKIETYIGTHPLPSDANVEAARRIVEFVSGHSEDDLVLAFISGGGSTLLCLHEKPMTCVDESMLFMALTQAGATIEEINTVRKHLSPARGGGLAKAGYPAEIVSLIVSDVPGNDLAYIASGPTVLDTSTVEDAHAVLAKYQVPVPENAAFIETPKEEKYFEHVRNLLLLTNKHALDALSHAAQAHGYAPEIVDDRMSGEASDIGRVIAARLHEAPAKTALFFAGESTVLLPAVHGAGGRNLEMALAALTDIGDGELVLPFASDGHDNTELAGGIADATTREHAAAKGCVAEEYLAAHRSLDFFTTTGDGLTTGYTGTNVSDLVIALKR